MLWHKTLTLMLAVASLAAAAGCQSRKAVALEDAWCAPGASLASAGRIGTFRGEELVLAYYRSAAHHAWLEDLIARRDAARETDDLERVRELEARGALSQDRAHKQMWGDASLRNILDHLADDLPGIAARTGVDAIVEKPGAAGFKAERVDVTHQLVCCFTPVAVWYVAEEPAGEIRRIGTVRRRELLKAYYGSAIHRQWLRELRARRDAAEAAGRIERVAELDEQGRAAQELAHRQVKGKAPLDNIREYLTTAFPRIARQAHVDIIAEAGKIREPSSEFVDVTDRVVARFVAAAIE